ncbi:nuclear fragile X mental retardation-interacting protein 1-like [Bombus vosnesenskii]|uniref:Nuclear fragile X mental retardation-interacting protein 1-like n=1 Tax=Bombus vosnesenskii TaxID=207650 RepID=A0A6J3KED6_9HYME|nr:nuclear fragile X mental retardation-interacting protein 1-like [Bombus vosnesenskii]
MSPLNRGPLLGPRVPPAGIRPPPPPRFGGRLPPPGLPPRMPPPPMNPVFGPIRQRLPPPPRPVGVNRPSGPMPLFGPRVRGIAPMVPPISLRGVGPRGPLMRPWHRRALPPQILSHMRPRFSVGNGNAKGKALNNVKKVSKLEELELKKPWMTDEIRSEIQKKNKLYAKAKKNKDAKEWEEFKDLRNKVTRMIRDAKNDYLAKHPEQAHLYPSDEEPYDQRDENYISSEDDELFYCEICDKDFSSEDALSEHKTGHKLCGIDGCTFSAHPLLIEKHIIMQHNTGLYHKIKNVSTPEEIEKWIMERKRRYPTKANVELRKAEEMEKVQRGEIIKQKQEVTKRKRKNFVRSNNQKTAIKKEPIKISNNFVELKEKYRGVYQFSGTLSLRNESLQTEDQSNNDIKDDYKENNNYISDEEETLVALPKFTIATCSIPNLVADYRSASEESDAPEEIPLKQIKLDNDTIIEESSAMKKMVDKNKVVGNNLQSTDTVPKISKIKQPITVKRNSNTTINKKQPYTSQLLQKLLSRSIQHERNLICQCVKYIVDNNFFD